MVQTKTIGALMIGFSIILLFLLAFVKRDLDARDTILCEQFHLNNLPMDSCPVHKSNTSWLLVLAFGLGFLMLGIGVYMLFIPRVSFSSGHSKKEFKQIDLSGLGTEEKQVYELLKTKGGSGYQSDLIKETNFSKVKITRILDRMEQEGILERKRRGMTNIIVLQ